MRSLLVLAVTGLLFVGFGFAPVNDPVLETKNSAKDVKPIKEVMAEAMKGGLVKKVKSGKATDEEKLQFLNLMISLVENEPPQGDAIEWKMQSGTLMMEAAKVVVGREGALETFGEASNCKACHDKFKP